MLAMNIFGDIIAISEVYQEYSSKRSEILTNSIKITEYKDFTSNPQTNTIKNSQSMNGNSKPPSKSKTTKRTFPQISKFTSSEGVESNLSQLNSSNGNYL